MPSFRGPQYGEAAEMRSWRAVRRERIELAEAVADALISELGVEAYREARRRKRDAITDDLTTHWGRVALAVARKIGRPDQVDTATPHLTKKHSRFQMHPGMTKMTVRG